MPKISLPAPAASPAPFNQFGNRKGGMGVFVGHLIFLLAKTNLIVIVMGVFTESYIKI